MKIILCYDMPKSKPAKDRQEKLSGTKQDSQINFLLQHLPLTGHTPVAVGFTGAPEKYAEKVRALKPDLLWNLFDTFQGEKALSYMGALLLDDIAIRHVGSPAQTLLFTANKPVTHTILKEARIPAVGHFSLGDSDTELPGTHWVLKPLSRNGDEYPVRAARVEDLQKAIILKSLQGEYYAEQYIEGRQFYMALLSEGGIKPIATGEILRNKTVSFRIQEKSLITRMQDIGVKCIKVFNLKGFGAISFIVDDLGHIHVTGVDARPMLTERSLFSQSCASAGINTTQMLSAIIRP